MASTQDEAALGSPEDLELRLKLVPPRDSARGYFFTCALELVRERGDEEALRRCLEVSGQKDFTALLKYPVSTLLRLLYQAAWALEGSSGGFENALRELGHRTAKEFLGNSVGKALLLVAGRSTKWLVDTLPSAYRTGWHHGTGAVKWTGPTQSLASIHGNVVPAPYFEGVFQAVFQAAGAPGFQVRGLQRGPTDTEYELSWE
jgi:uncharacterized protein (TIGR02265 family)